MQSPVIRSYLYISDQCQITQRILYDRASFDAAPTDDIEGVDLYVSYV